MGITDKEIVQSVELSQMISNKPINYTIANDYEEENTSIKVVKIIQGYTNIIKKGVWGKS